LAILALLSPAVAVPSASAADAEGINLVPLPNHSTVGNTVTCLADNFKVTFKGKAPKDLRAASTRAVANLRDSKMRYLSTSYGGEFFPNGAKCEHKIKELQITINDASDIAAHAVKPVETRQAAESYKLSIPTDGVAVVTAETALGAFRGLTSFENLFYKIGADGDLAVQEGAASRMLALLSTRHGGGAKRDIAYAPFAPYEIVDKPHFGWRSILLDTSRHYYPLEKLMGMLDTMAKVKLNVFHWHITDSQAWPLELSSLPELAENGAYQKGRTYSEADVKKLIAYAAARGIDVVIEIDTPGHTDSIYHSHPDLIACHEARPWATNANEPPAG
jgi:hexosaminidase